MTQKPANRPENRQPSDSSDDASRTIGSWMIALLWIIILAGGTLLANQWIKKQTEAQSPVVLTDQNGRTSVSVNADRYGQYRVIGGANGRPLTYLLDTGASGISIPENLAYELGLKKGRPFTVNTANGQVTVYSTTIEELSVGPFALYGVSAHINPGMDSDFALLGMSYLKHFELTQRDGELTIRAP